jgi:porphobilinogen synthase
LIFFNKNTTNDPKDSHARWSRHNVEFATIGHMNMPAQLPAYPAARPRRLRRDAFTRNLVREHAVTPHDLIYPVFVLEGQGRREAVGSMPGVERLSLDLLLPVAEDCVKLGIPVMALFPVISQHLKTPDGIEATNPDGLVPTVVRALKKEFPDLGVMTDVAWTPSPAMARTACWMTTTTSSTTPR